MADAALQGLRVLIVEDDYFIADDLRRVLEKQGMVVLGPAPSVAAALALLERFQDISGAVLDINLAGEEIFPVADLLLARGIPFLFATGYDRSAIPSRYADIVRCEKPVRGTAVLRALGPAMA